eukprot:2660907-Pleurochrysis_carterae.AAC.1
MSLQICCPLRFQTGANFVDCNLCAALSLRFTRLRVCSLLCVLRSSTNRAQRRRRSPRCRWASRPSIWRRRRTFGTSRVRARRPPDEPAVPFPLPVTAAAAAAAPAEAGPARHPDWSPLPSR